jgi:hypothetical protein
MIHHVEPMLRPRSPLLPAALTFVTGGVYSLYWFGKNWIDINPSQRSRRHVIAHAIALAIPIYGVFRLHAHIMRLRDLAVSSGDRGELNINLFILLAIANGMLIGPGSVAIVILLVRAGFNATVALAVVCIGSLTLTAALSGWAQAGTIDMHRR